MADRLEQRPRLSVADEQSIIRDQISSVARSLGNVTMRGRSKQIALAAAADGARGAAHAGFDLGYKQAVADILKLEQPDEPVQDPEHRPTKRVDVAPVLVEIPVKDLVTGSEY